jgi:LmbE family N-acetylglucosaminyl deacetylase
MAGCVLHLAPHPDDELLGAPATLVTLRDLGWRIVNIACSLGAASDHARRREELIDASARIGFELRIPDVPVAMSASSGDDLGAARSRLVELVATALKELDPDVVMSPSPHDGHPAHELVARAAEEAMSAEHRSNRWWMWGLWGPLPLPTIGTAFHAAVMKEILSALEAHRGELERADYRKALRGRAEMYAGLGAELLSGFGTPGTAAEYAELVTEVVGESGTWLLGAARWLQADTITVPPTQVDVSDWVRAETLTSRFGTALDRAAQVRA